VTDPRKQRFAAYLRTLADLIGLKDWTFRIDDEPPADRGHCAAIGCIQGKRRAVLRFSEEFLDGTPGQRREWLAHELIHCHGALVDEVAETGLSNDDRRVYTLLSENMVDALAVALAPHMPLPTDDDPPEEPTPMPSKPAKTKAPAKPKPKAAPAPKKSPGKLARARAQEIARKITNGF
jgi:hypothetical protein